MDVIDFTPYDVSGNLGKAYNLCASLVTNDEDYFIFRDRDVIYLTPDYMQLIHYNIISNPTIRAFTGTCNRVGYKPQKDQNAPQSNDIKEHVAYAKQKQKEMYQATVDITDRGTFSGFWMCFKKSLWNEIGGSKEDRLITIDNFLHRRIRDNGDKILLLEGLYLYHIYSLYDGIGERDISHLK